MKRILTASLQAFVLFSLFVILAWRYSTYESWSETTQHATEYLTSSDEFPLQPNIPLTHPMRTSPTPEATSSTADGREVSKTAELAAVPTINMETLSTQSSISSETPTVEASLVPDLLQNASIYVQAIMNPDDHVFHRLECLPPTHRRYDYLKAQPSTSNSTTSKPKYFFALDLYQCASILPRLLGSVIETIDFLGPENCVLSIVEGRSTDGTNEILSALREPFVARGIEYHFTTNNIDPKAGEGTDRIQALADLRNQALLPLTNFPHTYDPDTTVLFINDIALCMEDMLELLHQRTEQSADMTCAMDWIFGGWSFYDVWISRGMSGDQFFEIPQSGAWDFADNLFWNDPDSRARLDNGRPFQVFACWNGVTAFTARPLLEGVIRFRTAHEDECYLGEPTHFCKDLWWLGHKRIAVIPSVNVGYDDEESRKIKAQHGTVSRWVEREAEKEDKIPMHIEWDPEPPEKIKCVPTYQKPTWVRWDQGLGPRNTTRAEVSKGQMELAA